VYRVSEGHEYDRGHCRACRSPHQPALALPGKGGTRAKWYDEWQRAIPTRTDPAGPPRASGGAPTDGADRHLFTTSLLYFSPVLFADFVPVQFDDDLLDMSPFPRPNPPESV